MALSHHAWNSAHVNVVHHESRSFCDTFCQWIGLREKLQESPIFHRKNYGFL
jgi:hypothetical protein